MDPLLWLFLVAILLVIAVWWVTKDRLGPLDFSGERGFLLEQIWRRHIGMKEPPQLTLAEEHKLAHSTAQLLSGQNLAPDLVICGRDLSPLHKNGTLYDLNELLAVPGEIVVLNRPLGIAGCWNFTQAAQALYYLHQKELIVPLHEYLGPILEDRRSRLREILGSQVSFNGPYAYLPESLLPPQVKGLPTPMGTRLNLLEGHLQFRYLWERWESMLGKRSFSTLQ